MIPRPLHIERSPPPFSICTLSQYQERQLIIVLGGEVEAAKEVAGWVTATEHPKQCKGPPKAQWRVDQ
jgi:hypothetical protein